MIRRVNEAAPPPSHDATPKRVGPDGWVLVAALALATLLPLSDAIGRPLGFHVSGSAAYLQQVTLWLTFVGGLVATRHRTHLTLSTAELLRSDRARRAAGLLAACVAAAVLAALAYSGVELIRANREQGKILGAGIPEWASECVIPISLALMASWFAWMAPGGWRGRALAVAAVGVAFGLGLIPPPDDPAQWPITRSSLVWPVTALILGGALLGAPVFVAMGGLALLFFFKDGTPIGAVSAEVYRLIASPDHSRHSRSSRPPASCSPPANPRRGSCAASRRSSAGCRAESRSSWSWPAPPSRPGPAARASRSWPWAASCCPCSRRRAIRKASRSVW